MEMILESKGIILYSSSFPQNYLLISSLFILGVPQLNTPPPVSRTLLTESQEKKIAAPRLIRVSTDNIANLDDLVQPWTRSSPKKLDHEHVLAKWQFIPGLKFG
jgi:hypothetical protein